MRISARTWILVAAIAVLGWTVDAGSAGADASSDASVPASQEFWQHWGDGKAELSGYRIVTPRYGELRQGIVVLIYVTEDMHKTTLIKDDTGRLPASEKQAVLKLNHAMNFSTGIYPYSIMTSVFSPVTVGGRERFSPVKISFSAQEWCGHVYHSIKPAVVAFASEIRSYFSSEGEQLETVRTPPQTLYEDALLIQLRELDGPFAGGEAWSGSVVPTLWRARRGHQELAPQAATIERRDADLEGIPVTRFTLKMGDYERQYDVEKSAPRRVVRWSTSDGEVATILRTKRLAYWQLNSEGDEQYLRELGLEGAGSL